MFTTCSVQLYVPPEYMMNKDFLKEVFAADTFCSQYLADDEERRKVHDVLPKEDG